MATGCFLNPELRHQEGSDLVVLGTAELKHKKSISWPTMHGGNVSKRNLMEFTIASNEIQHIVIRNSKIGWTEEKCIEMDKLAQEDHSYCPLPEEFNRYWKIWYISLSKSGRNAPMKLRSDFREALTDMHRLHRESGEERPEPIPFSSIPKVAFVVFFIQYLMVAVE